MERMSINDMQFAPMLDFAQQLHGRHPGCLASRNRERGIMRIIHSLLSIPLSILIL
jgi:hypothetical protein